jgi:hypothetical protein
LRLAAASLLRQIHSQSSKIIAITSLATFLLQQERHRRGSLLYFCAATFQRFSTMGLPAKAQIATRSTLLQQMMRRGVVLLFTILVVAAVLIAQTPAPATAQSTSTSSSTSVTAGQSTAPAALAAPAAATKATHLTATSGPPPEDVNRKALEERAGKDAGKILVRSVPSRARIYINGAFVGYTPQLFIVPPAKYKIELRGQRDNYAEKTLGLLPNDTQEMTLNLTARYPLHVGSH